MERRLAASIEQSARSTDRPYRLMFTGAGHDACNIDRFMPTSMIFVPCQDGISHNEVQWTEPKHCAIAAQVLTETLQAAANGEIDFGGAS